MFDNNTATMNRGRSKAEGVSQSSGDRQAPPLEGAADETSNGVKRVSGYPMQRRGSRKKTLSLNPEEREALENLIEEVIMGGVGEGVIDSDASSDEEVDVDDMQAAQTSVSNSSVPVVAGDACRNETFVKGGKKFYPGQLKVALKHMHDLPPRFVRKLAKAQQYLDAGGNMYSRATVSVGPIEEEEESTMYNRDDSKQSKPTTIAVTPERDRDKARLKENKLKDAKKVIRTLLTDRDQYVDETVGTVVVSGPSQPALSSDQFPSTVSSSDEQHDALPHPIGSDAAVSVTKSTSCVNSGSFSTEMSYAASTCIYHPRTMASMMANRAVDSDLKYGSGPLSDVAVSGSRPIPAPHFQPPSMGIPQYQLGVPMVHGMKPAPVIGQSPPGTQFWIPQSMVPNSGPAFYGSSPPVVGITGVPSAFNPPVQYAYPLQSSYPNVPAVPASYSPQYLYSASPPNQGMVGPGYSAVPFSQPISYPLTLVHHPEQYVQSPAAPVAMPTHYYRDTPPPGYCPTQSHPTCGQRRMFSDETALTMDRTRNQVLYSDAVHNPSALPVPVVPGNASPVQSVSCGARSEGAEYAVSSRGSNIASSGHVSVNQPATRYRSVLDHSPNSGIGVPQQIKSHQCSPEMASALKSHQARPLRSPVGVPRLSSLRTSVCSPGSAVDVSCVPAHLPCPDAVKSTIVEVSSVDSDVTDSSDQNPSVEPSDLDLSHPDNTPPKSEHVAVSSCASTTSSGSTIYTNSTGSRDYICSSERGAETSASSGSSCSCHNVPPLSVQRRDSKDVVDEQSLEHVTQPLKELDISGTAAVLAEYGVDLGSARPDMHSVSSGPAVQSSTGNESAELEKSWCEDNVSSVFQSVLSVSPEAGDLKRCSEDASHICHTSPYQTSCTEQPSASSAESADISLIRTVRDATVGDSAAGLLVTLSSSLTSALVEMFGALPGTEPDHAADSSTVSGRVWLSHSAVHAIYVSWLQSLSTQSKSDTT